MEPEWADTHEKSTGWEEVWGRREHLILAALAKECEKATVGLSVFCANQSVACSMLNASNTMNFEIPQEMAGWNLRQSLNDHLKYEQMKDAPKIPVGELYQERC